MAKYDLHIILHEVNYKAHFCRANDMHLEIIDQGRKLAAREESEVNGITIKASGLLLFSNIEQLRQLLDEIARKQSKGRSVSITLDFNSLVYLDQSACQILVKAINQQCVNNFHIMAQRGTFFLQK